jgi:multiple sugar transport system ATP-binding protein
MAVASVDLIGIGKRFGATEVLQDVTLRAADGEFLAILGASGCGKSTLLRILAGLEGADRGQVRLGGEEVGHLRPKARDLAMVFQSYALYPYMTVRQNITLPLQMRRLSALQRLPLLGRLAPGGRALRAGITADVDAVAGPLQLSALMERRPAQLSGGQRQRVALGRAMVRQPAAFLMDEPLSNLDAKLRVEARAEIVAMQRRLSATILYVTHDQVEAMTMADRVAVMQAGRVLQVASPQHLYDEPASIDVARFVGSPPMNIIPALLDETGMVELAGHVLPWHAQGRAGARVMAGIRPESLVPRPGGLPATLKRVERLGAEAVLHCALPGVEDTVLARVETAIANGLSPGGTIPLMPRRVLLFQEAGLRMECRPHPAATPAMEGALG